MIEHAEPDKVDELQKKLSQPLHRDDRPRVMKESLQKIGFVPAWWVDDEEASSSSMNAAKEMKLR